MACKNVKDCPSNIEFWGDETAWRKAVLELLADVAIDVEIGDLTLDAGTNHIGSVTIDTELPAGDNVIGSTGVATIQSSQLGMQTTAFGSLNTSTFVSILTNGTYPNGSPLRMIPITNDTDVAIIISLDGTNPHVYVPSKTVYELELASYGLHHPGPVYAKLAATATAGSVYCGGIY